jgi:drug/metabolite transporter (DMT)-like permease
MKDSASGNSGDRFAIILAFAAIYVIWGTTFLGIALAIKTIPPFISGGSRFVLASGVMYAWLRLRRPQALVGVKFWPAFFCGVLLTGFGNGLVVWAQQGIPSGIAALVVASIPISIMAIDWLFFSRQAPTVPALIGISIATAGVATIVFSTHSLNGGVNPWYLGSIMLAVVGWSFGTLMQKRALGAASILGFTVVQMLGGGTFQLVMATLTAEWSALHVASISTTSILALVYLAIFGSIIALSCYSWLLTRVSPQQVTTYSLVNPVVAVVLGAVVLNERITAIEVGAGLFVLLGVTLVLFRDVVWPSQRRAPVSPGVMTKTVDG